MQSSAQTPQSYLEQLPPDRREAISRLRTIFNQSLPQGFEEIMSSGMINYVVPFSLYPPGYHCKPVQPLPFLAIASQKNFVAVYHMGLYSQPALLEWFLAEYPKHTNAKLDMGKSCIRFKKVDAIPYALFEELAKKITPDDWIAIYEQGRSEHRRGV